MKRILLCAILSACIAAAQPATERRTPPKLNGQTANDQPIVLPDAAAGKIALLLVGFSRQAGDQSAPWDRHVSEEFAHDPHVAVYTIAMLEDLPSMFRGLVKSSIRKGTAPAKRAYAVTTMTGTHEWEVFTSATDLKVPYLILLDSTGIARWSGHGTWDDRQFQSMSAVIQSLEAEEKASQKQ